MEITTWRHQGAKKQLSKDKLFKKVLFLKGGQKMGNQDLEASAVYFYFFVRCLPLPIV